jgi:hypothetical protein
MEKEVVFLGVTSYLEFIKEAGVLAARRICITIIEFLKSQQVEFLSNLCWKP